MSDKGLTVVGNSEKNEITEEKKKAIYVFLVLLFCMWWKKAAIKSLNFQEIQEKPLVYNVDPNKQSVAVYSKFFKSTLDDGTKQFLQEYCSGVESCGMTFISNLFRCMYSVTDTNAILHRGQMHVLSVEQLRRLFTSLPELEPFLYKACTLLDIGSGDGNVTDKLGTVLCTESITNELTEADLERLLNDLNNVAWKSRVVTTELSNYMVKRLRKSGYACVNTTNITREELLPHLRVGAPSTSSRRAFDVVSLFNVLDRCDTPLTLLRQIRELLLPEGDDGSSSESGVLILAVVLPWKPFVESGSGQLQPSETVPIRGPSSFWPRPNEESDPKPNTDQPLTSEYFPTRKTSKLPCACCCSFEAAVDWFVWNILVKEGWEIHRWTRVPYISAGDMNCSYYTLNNAVFLLKPTLIP